MIRIIQHSWKNLGRPHRDSPLWEYVDKPVDLVFADPPYNLGVEYADDPTGDKLGPQEYQTWVSYLLFQFSAMVREGGTVWWLCPANDGWWVWPLLNKYFHCAWGKPIIWNERFSQYQQDRLTSDYRLLFPMVKGYGVKPTFNPDAIREKSVRQEMGDPRADPRGRVPGHVWTVRRLQGTAKDRVDWHPAQLAPEPLSRIVAGWTQPGQTVLDAFAGSGSMGLVCKALGRNFVGIDQSAEYCRRMAERLG